MVGISVAHTWGVILNVAIVAGNPRNPAGSGLYIRKVYEEFSSQWKHFMAPGALILANECNRDNVALGAGLGRAAAAGSLIVHSNSRRRTTKDEHWQRFRAPLFTPVYERWKNSATVSKSLK